LREFLYATAHPDKFLGPLQHSSNTDNLPLSFSTLAAVKALYWEQWYGRERSCFRELTPIFRTHVLKNTVLKIQKGKGKAAGLPNVQLSTYDRAEAAT